MHKKRFAFLSVVLAMLCAFALVFAACDNGENSGETPSTGDPFEGYVEVPAEDAGSAPATISLNARTLSVAYGGTVQVTATVGNPVAGTVTWSVEEPETGDAPITIADGATAQIDAEHATATVTLEGAAYTGETSYTVTATFAATGSESNTASASCEVTVGTRTVTVEVSGSASALYTDGEESEKSATLTAAVTGLSADETATVVWTLNDGAEAFVTKTDNGASTEVSLIDGAALGTVTVTAEVTYNNGNTTATASDSFAVTVTSHALNYIAYMDFDSDTDSSDTDVSLNSQFSSAAAFLSAQYTPNTVQNVTAHAGYAFAVTKNTGAAGSCTAPGIEVTVSENASLVGSGETLAFSFWFNTSQGEDWNVIARVGDNSRITFGNLCSSSGNMWPGGGDNGAGGTLENGSAWDVISEAADVQNAWNYITVTVSEASGIQFYKNGTLVLTYPVSNTRVAALVSEFLGVFRNGGTIVFFSNNENAGSGVDYIDDLQITKNISAADLYAAATATE